MICADNKASLNKPRNKYSVSHIAWKLFSFRWNCKWLKDIESGIEIGLSKEQFI
jgi:hypothetical protein